jgi:protein-S-isoprenylcysteine O-methyltransferase Ste14
LKERVFPDGNWQKRITFPAAGAMWIGVLGPYWISPMLIVIGRREAPAWLLGVATLVYVVGVVVMMGSDAQKYFVLQKTRGLITDGFFARVRHPNYLGEMMLYSAFAALSMHWAPWVVLAVVWSLVFLPNMLRKERSMARYAQWPAYRAQSGFLLPRLFRSTPLARGIDAPPTQGRQTPTL